MEINDSIENSIRDELLRSACREVERRVLENQQQVSESILEESSALSGDPEAVIEVVYTEFVARTDRGEIVPIETLIERFPEHRDRLQRLLAVHDIFADDARIAQDVDTAGGVETGTTTSRDEPPAPDDRPVYHGRYEIVEPIDEGAKGVVYRAWQPDLKRYVALKMMKSSWRNAEDEQRFQLEAQSAAKLRHPNIVEVYDVGEDHGRPYLCMELLEGGNVEQKIRENPFAFEQAATIVECLADAMHFAHERGIVHRDLKPANILLTKTGRPKITDFGLAKADDDLALTQTGAVMGTPCYMAPEQARGDSSEVDGRTDVYALGGILYALLTGRPPFLGESQVEILDAIRLQDPVSPARLRPRLPRDLETITLKCLSKEPEKRYGTAAELAEDLRRYQEKQPIRARRPSWLGHVTKWCRRKPLAASLATGLLVAVTIGVASVSYLYYRSEQLRGLAEQQAAKAEHQSELAKAAAKEALAEKQRAQREADEALAMTRLMQNSQFASERAGTDRYRMQAAKAIADFYARKLREEVDTRYQSDYALSLQSLAKIQFDRALFDESEKSTAAASDILKELDGNWYQTRHAQLLIEQARMAIVKQNFEQADGLLAQAEPTFLKGLQVESIARQSQYNLGVLEVEKANILLAKEDYAAAKTVYLRAIGRITRRPAADKPAPKNSGSNSSGRLIPRKSLAFRKLAASAKTAERLRLISTTILVDMSVLCDAYDGLALCLRELRDLDEAERYARLARAHFQGLAARFVERPETQFKIVRNQRVLARILRSQKQYEASRQLYLVASGSAAVLASRFPDRFTFTAENAECESQHAMLLWRMKRYKESRQHFQRSSSLWQRAYKQTNLDHFRARAAQDINMMGVNIRKMLGI